ncbi:MAG: peptide methionine sulfoxide reductase [Lapillicoccus sp.]
MSRVGDEPDELQALVDRVPEGWTRVEVDGRAYGLTRTTHTGGRSVSLYAEELGGTDVVSANVWRLAGGTVLKPCEMPVAKVEAFLRDWEA